MLITGDPPMVSEGGCVKVSAQDERRDTILMYMISTHMSIVSH
jgi:hypothetical protein